MTDWTAYAAPVTRHGPAGLTARTAAHYRDVSDRFVARHGAVVSAMPGSGALWRRWRAGDGRWAVDWHRSVGALEPRGTVNPSDAARSWAQFVLHLCEAGVDGAWSASFARPVALQVRDELHSRVRAVRCVRRGPTFRTEVTHAPFRGSRALQTGATVRSPYVRWRGLTVSFIPLAEFALFDGPHRDTRPPAADGVEEQWLWNFAAAAQLLDEYAPEYSRWVRRVVRQVVALPPVPGCTMSSSDARAPGVVRLSLAHDAATIAELLVHEATHAYFHLLEHAGPVEDGSDPTLYYSPFKRAMRPIRAILLAFHAFANVALLYETLLRTGAPVNAPAVRHALEELTVHLDAITPALTSTSALTDLGAAMRDLLLQRLAETRRAVAYA